MLKIYIARHGQNEDNANGILNGHRDLPLTKVGRQQALELSEGIKGSGLKLDAVYTSPLIRAYETANIVVNALNLPSPKIMGELKERDFGIMTGKPVKNIEKLSEEEIVKTNTITYFLSPKGAETFPKLLNRATKALELIQSKHSDGSVLLVTHGDIGKMLYASYYEIPWMNVLTMFHFGNSELLLLSDDSNAGDVHVINIKQYNH